MQTHPIIFELVKRSGHILAISPYKKASQIVANFNNYLDSFFSETISVHGVLVELFGFGVLLTGKSGIGKSETALELIHRGHRLIADDMVKFLEIHREMLLESLLNFHSLWKLGA